MKDSLKIKNAGAGATRKAGVSLQQAADAFSQVAEELRKRPPLGYVIYYNHIAKKMRSDDEHTED